MTGVEGLEARRRPGKRSRVHLRAQRNRRCRRQRRRFPSLPRVRPSSSSRDRPPRGFRESRGRSPACGPWMTRDHKMFAVGRTLPAKSMPSRATVASSSGRACGLERELWIDRARDAGGEKRLLVGLRQRPERGERLAVDPRSPSSRARGRSDPPASPRPATSPRTIRVVQALDRAGRQFRGTRCRARSRRSLTRNTERAAWKTARSNAAAKSWARVGLDQRATDRAEVVRQPDADAGLFPRLGLAVPRERSGRGDRRSVHAEHGRGRRRPSSVQCPACPRASRDPSTRSMRWPSRTDGDNASGDRPRSSLRNSARASTASSDFLAEPRFDPATVSASSLGRSSQSSSTVLELFTAGLPCSVVDLPRLSVVGRFRRQRDTAGR